VRVRADLGQIEPRVLRRGVRDRALAAATAEDDCSRGRSLSSGQAGGEVAVLAAMYGQTSGAAVGALRGWSRAYPTAPCLPARRLRAGPARRDVAHLRRLSWSGSARPPAGLDDSAARTAGGAAGWRVRAQRRRAGSRRRGFKVWAVTVRARAAARTPASVLCLHDELLLHVPTEACPPPPELLHNVPRRGGTPRRLVPGRLGAVSSPTSA